MKAKQAPQIVEPELPLIQFHVSPMVLRVVECCVSAIQEFEKRLQIIEERLSYVESQTGTNYD